MVDNFQKEVPRARINITLDVETGGARRKKELPLKLLVIGNFSNKNNLLTKIGERERINITKENFEQVLSDVSPELNFDINNLNNDPKAKFHLQLRFKKFKDFHPDYIIQQVPELSKLIAMRNLLKDLKSNILDNHLFRKELERLLKDKQELLFLRQELKNNAPLRMELR